MRAPWKPVVLDEVRVDLSARPLSSAVRLCVKGDGPLDEAALARALTAGDERGWRMDELVVGSEQLARAGREILSHDRGRWSPLSDAVYLDEEIGPDGWFVRGGRA